MKTFSAAMAILLFPVLTSAQVVSVVPGQFASSAATGVFTGPFVSSARRYMLLITQSELAAHLDRNITGLTFRIPTSATAAWPAAETTYADYTIKLSRGVEPSARSLVFASNLVGDQTTVRSGPLTLTTSVFPFGGSPNAFGPTITFNTPYLYKGGPLVIDLVHTGAGATRSVEATVATGGPTGVYGVLVSALWSSNVTGSSGSQGNFAIMQLKSDPAPSGLNGTVTLSDSDGDASNEIVTLEVVNSGSSTLVQSVSAILNVLGGYSATISVPDGTYDVYIKGDTFLKKRVAGVVISSNTGTASPTLTNGDVSGNNEVGPEDFASLGLAFGAFLGDPNYSALADLNDDEEVGPADFSILANSFGEFGDDF